MTENTEISPGSNRSKYRTPIYIQESNGRLVLWELENQLSSENTNERAEIGNRPTVRPPMTPQPESIRNEEHIYSENRGYPNPNKFPGRHASIGGKNASSKIGNKFKQSPQISANNNSMPEGHLENTAVAKNDKIRPREKTLSREQETNEQFIDGVKKLSVNADPRAHSRPKTWTSAPPETRPRNWRNNKPGPENGFLPHHCTGTIPKQGKHTFHPPGFGCPPGQARQRDSADLGARYRPRTWTSPPPGCRRNGWHHPGAPPPRGGMGHHRPPGHPPGKHPATSYRHQKPGYGKTPHGSTENLQQQILSLQAKMSALEQETRGKSEQPQINDWESNYLTTLEYLEGKNARLQEQIRSYEVMIKEIKESEEQAVQRFETLSIRERENLQKEEVLQQREARNQKNMMCPICFISWEESGQHRVVSLACGHLFGDSCIRDALSQTNRCPICRKNVSVSDIRYIFSAAIFSAP